MVKPSLNRERLALNKQRLNQDTSQKDVVCSKCQHKGHIAANCKSAYTTSGIFIGRGEPPANHYWTKQHAKEAENLRQIKAAMVKKTAPPQPA
jgi:hypothetical protein